ncbi:MAG TPA: alpha/beta hydrolase-fold protein, partial [Lacibacter sp.]|nr:alpha/beta hydrolase-fold protein [Lacibacter sp.]
MRYHLLFVSTLLFFATSASAQTKTEEKIFPLGIIRQLHSVELNENRTLNIYLPEGYHKDSSYQVIYLLDGSADEDFIHVAGLVQFYNFPWVNVLPKSIVVGIA